MTGTSFSLEVQPKIPQRLERLEELANDLLYSWDRAVRRLFYRLDRDLWETTRHKPRVFLRQISQQRLEEASEDRIFMEDYNRVLSVYDSYHNEKAKLGVEELLNHETDLVAYFCAEFGFHESLPIYSGGLGILAGDHCKAASDLNIPFIAVGLLYRQGYFTQTIDRYGKQVAHQISTDFDDLPIKPACDANGQEIHVSVTMVNREVVLKVWQAKAGHITLYLLDSDLPENTEADCQITHQLYGGDITMRIQQEIVLGIGGVRALRALDLKPTVWHINEGHAAFMILERCREFVANNKMDFDSALELVASGTVFTTHTPVPAGHDIFDHQLIVTYFSDYVKKLGVNIEHFLLLGSCGNNQLSFNQTTLALKGSRYHNGVSRIHGNVASQMEQQVWPQIPDEENPISYVTNGVHVPTFLAREWVNLLDMRFGGEWRNELRNEEYWERIDEIPNQTYWSMRQTLKAELLMNIRRRAVHQHRRNGCSESMIDRITHHLQPHETDILTIGFARRFATYKRATLLFSDHERLARLLNNPERPVIFVFAGKAHPNDQPGQHLIEVIHNFSRKPEFLGKIILLEGYDLSLGRKLVTGVDVWLNTPEYPLEASGTSGQKCGINGVINLSVLDGWWGEGYNGENGWSITPHGPQFDASYRNQEEAQELLDTLEYQTIPLYYNRNNHGYSEGWVKMSKASMKSTMPRFNSQRMVMDYARDYYSKASKHSRLLADNDGASAKLLAHWKNEVRTIWPKVKIRRTDECLEAISSGEHATIEVALHLHGLRAEDVVIECIVGTNDEHGDFERDNTYKFEACGSNRNGETLFKLDLMPNLPGKQYYKIRAYPYIKYLSHPFETGCMIWL